MISKLSPLALGLLLSPVCAFGQMNLTFDASALGNPNLNGDNVFVTFAAEKAELVLNSGGTPQTITFDNKLINIGGTNFGTSDAYSLNTIASMGLQINYATSLSGFISYGSSAGIAKLAAGTQPLIFPGGTGSPTAETRWSQFEVSYGNVPGIAGFQSGADLTNISQFGGALKMEIFQGATSQGFTGNSLSTGQTMRNLHALSGFDPNAVVQNGGQYVRLIGPNVFPASVSGMDVKNPYPKFNDYMKSLNTKFGDTGNAVPGGITNLAPGQSPGGMGAVGTTAAASGSGATANIVAGNTYDLDYHFGAKVVQVTAPVGDNPGTYSVELTGFVNATGRNGAGNTGTQETTTFTALSILVSADNTTSDFLTNFIYQQSLTGNGISTTLLGWDDLNTLFSSAFVSAALQEKVAGDFSQGILTGLVDSVGAGNKSSYEWWTQESQNAYANAQSNPDFYSQWANEIYINSPGADTSAESGPFSFGSVYGSPFDDRFNSQLLSPNSNTTEMKITLLPDGDLSVVPEPGTSGLILVGLATTLWGLRRRR